MSLRHLTIFVAVYQQLSFTKAGHALHLAQPSVSLAIKELEEKYQVILFDRIKHQIYPTSSGEKLYKYATNIISLYNEMENSMQNGQDLHKIKIGSSITIGNHLLPTLIKQFNQLYPQIQIEVNINNCLTNETNILKNKLDFALIENKPSSDKISSMPFFKDYLYPIASNKHHLAKEKNISLAKVCQENFLMREPGSSVRLLVESIFTTNQLQLKPTWQSTSTRALIEATKQNLGLTALPYQLIKQELDNRTLVILDIPLLKVERQYNIIYYQDKYLAKPILDFFNLCKSL